MSIKALKLDTVRRYESIYDGDRGTEDATIWLIGALDSRTSGRIRDAATKFTVDPNATADEVTTSINTSEVNFQRVQYGLKGFENFKDPDGNDVKFETRVVRKGNVSYTVVSEDVMALIPDAIISELADEIIKSNELTPAQAKN